jgi:hypothetical protein
VDGSPLLGDGEVNLSDWVQAGRFVLGLDPLTVQGGSTGPFTRLARTDERRDTVKPAGAGDGPSTLRLLASGWKPGVTNEVVVQLEAVGGENAVSFSLGYDPGLLSYVDAVLGSGAPGATLLLNPNATGEGQLGVVLLLPFGESLPAGVHDLLRVRLGVSELAEGMGTRLLLGDHPAARDIADAAGHSLAAAYVEATLDFSTAPLRITLAVLQAGELRLETEGVTGKPVVIQGSTDMLAWQNVATNATGVGPIRLPWAANETVRYFRAVAP